MSLFSKIFGTKDSAEKPAAQSDACDFMTTMSMHLRGELDQALAGYVRLAEEVPDGTLAPFFAASIKADKDSADAAESLRSLSLKVSLAEESLSHAVATELFAEIGLRRNLLPAVAPIIVAFGDLLKRDGFLRESVVCFEVAAGMVPDHANVLHKLGDTLHDLRIYDYAETVLLDALRHAPNHWGVLYTYAVLLQDLGRDEEALPYFDKAITFFPEHAKCQNNYGAALLRTNRLEEARVHCTEAARLDPRSPFAKINLGNICLLKQEYDRARTYFADAVSLDDTLAAAYFGLARAEQSLGSDPGKILELYLKVIEINPAISEAHHALGNVLAAAGNPEALAHFSAAARLNDNLPNLHKDFGTACLHLGSREEALEHLKKALQQNPDDAEAQDLLDRVQVG